MKLNKLLQIIINIIPMRYDTIQYKTEQNIIDYGKSNSEF